MSSASQVIIDVDTKLGQPILVPYWFAVQTRPRHEKKVHTKLVNEGITSFLPVVKQVRRWSDRRMEVDFPLFSCYVFVRIVPLAEKRVSVLCTSGVISFVGIQGQGIPIPDGSVDLFVTIGVALSPNTYVIGFEPERNEMLVHQLVPTRPASIDDLFSV